MWRLKLLQQFLAYTKILYMLATNILASIGATVDQCENGEEAVRLVDEGRTKKGLS
jgi:hypothetical protein